MKIMVKKDDGSEVDVTAAVQITYDALHASLDFSSNFLDTEEVGAMVLLAEAAGFPSFQEVLEDYWLNQRRREWHRTPEWNRGRFPELPIPDEERQAIMAEFRVAIAKAVEQ